MEGIERKQVYFEEREINPALIDLYFDRLDDPTKVLDIGCGRGSFGTVRSERDVEVVGVDIDSGALQVASEKEEAILCDLESGALPFKENTFDGIIAKDILEHLSDPTEILTEMRRVLEQGGRAVISVPMAKPKVVWGDYTHVRGFTEDALRTMVRDFGFEVISISPMGGIPGVGRLGLTRALPVLLQVPGFRRFATSHELVMKNQPDRDG